MQCVGGLLLQGLIICVQVYFVQYKSSMNLWQGMKQIVLFCPQVNAYRYFPDSRQSFFYFCFSSSYCLSIRLLILLFFGTVSLLSTVSIIKIKSSSSIVVTGNPAWPIHLAMASSLVCCSLESLLYFDALKRAVEILCWDVLVLFELSGPSFSFEVLCICEVER